MLILCGLLMSLQGLSQTMFQRVYGGQSYDVGCEVIQTTDNGYLIAGTTGSFGLESGQVLLIKTDEEGYEEWRKYYGGPYADQARSMEQMPDGSFVIAGFTESVQSSYDVFAIKVTAAGDTLWTSKIGGPEWDFCNQAAALNDGGIALFGTTYSFGSGEGDFYLVRLDSEGDTLWSRAYGGSSMETGESIAVASDGGFYLVGSTTSFGAGASDMYVVRTDSNGDTLWTRTWGGVEDDFCYAVATTPNDGYVLAGGTFNNSAGKSDFVIVMEDGVQQWVKYETKPGDNFLTDIIVEQGTNNITVTGYATGGGDFGGEDVRILRYGFDGVWNGVAKFHGSGADERSTDIKRTADNGYVMVGVTNGFMNRFDDVYLIKTDDQGLTLNPELGIEDELADQNGVAVNVAPNPIENGQARLLVAGFGQLRSEFDQPLVLQVYNSMGQLLLEDVINQSEHLLDLRNSTGIHHYLLTTEGRVIAAGKFVSVR